MGVKVSTGTPYVYAFAVITPGGDHKLLLINKRDRDIELLLPQRAHGVEFVDQTTKTDLPAKQDLDSDKLPLRGLSVAVVSFQPAH